MLETADVKDSSQDTSVNTYDTLKSTEENSTIFEYKEIVNSNSAESENPELQELPETKEEDTNQAQILVDDEEAEQIDPGSKSPVDDCSSQPPANFIPAHHQAKQALTEAHKPGK